MSNENINYSYEAPFSFSNWLGGWVKKIIQIARTHSKLMIAVAMVGGLLGLTYSILKPVRYQSEVTFLVEESKGIGGGMLSSLGGSLDLGITGLTGSSNTVLSGDNVLELLKSNTFMATCLKTPYGTDSNYSLADKYAEVYGYRKKWVGNSKIGREIFFGKVDKDSRLQDSLLKILIKRVEERELGVVKPDKKLGFFKVSIKTKDELLSLLIVERIIKISTDFYVNAKIGRIKTNVNRLEARTDSISQILNRRTYSAKEDARKLLNINPADINDQVYSEISQRDKMVLTSIYGELMKNLEVSKASLIQETPTIQIVDSPVFPLERDEIKWYVGFLMGIIYSMIIFLTVFLIKDEAGF